MKTDKTKGRSRQIHSDNQKLEFLSAVDRTSRKKISLTNPYQITIAPGLFPSEAPSVTQYTQNELEKFK